MTIDNYTIFDGPRPRRIANNDPNRTNPSFVSPNIQTKKQYQKRIKYIVKYSVQGGVTTRIFNNPVQALAFQRARQNDPNVDYVLRVQQLYV